MKSVHLLALVLVGVFFLGCIQEPPGTRDLPTPSLTTASTPTIDTPTQAPSDTPVSSPGPAGFKPFETRSDGATRITNPSKTQSDQNPAFLDENRILFTRFVDGYNQGKAQLVLLDLRDGSETVVVNDGGTAVSTSGNPFTPDKNQVCYSSDVESEDDVWCAPLSGGTPVRITQDESGNHFIEPSVRSDGRRIAFEMHPPGGIDASNGQIWSVDFFGNRNVVAADGADNRLPQYHPIENKILFQRKTKQVFELFQWDAATGKSTKIDAVTEEATDASWTKSGGIAYSGEGIELATPQIFLLKNGQNTHITQSAMLDSAPGASPDETRIAFESRTTENGPARIWMKTVPVHGPTDLALPKGTSFSWQLVEPVDTSIQADVVDIDLFQNDASVVQTLHAQNKKVICYLSAGTWEPFRPDAEEFPLNVIGKPYAPPFQDEKWLDVRDERVRAIMEKRVDLCKQKGFDGVEPDNIDAFAQDTGFSITAQDQLDYNRFLAEQAHQRGLSIGLKNDGGQTTALVRDFDFALVEECVADGFCEEFQPFSKAGKAVFIVEYTDRGTTLEELCPVAKTFGYYGVLKNRDLDAFEQTCSD